MKMIWGIAERYGRQNVWMRLALFDRVVGSILRYGAEIWGWREYKEIEIIQERYLKWLLRLHRTTPGYIIREELKREKIRVRTGKIAATYESKRIWGEMKF